MEPKVLRRTWRTRHEPNRAGEDFGHLVLNVTDTERALAFYCGELGLVPVRLDKWRRQEVIFPSVRVNGSTIIDLVQLPCTGENADHFSLVVEPMDFVELKQSGHFDVVEGPVQRYGARGDGTSLYIRDPIRTWSSFANTTDFRLKRLSRRTLAPRTATLGPQRV